MFTFSGLCIHINNFVKGNMIAKIKYGMFNFICINSVPHFFFVILVISAKNIGKKLADNLRG